MNVIGNQIIVDDIFVTEPFFQDGPISQAISEVTALGVTYFTAANNDSNYGYQADYQPVAFDTVDATVPEATRQLLAGKTLHNFGTADAPVAFQRITLGGVDGSAAAVRSAKTLMLGDAAAVFDSADDEGPTRKSSVALPAAVVARISPATPGS
jgi:hypothetical protein